MEWAIEAKRRTSDILKKSMQPEKRSVTAAGSRRKSLQEFAYKNPEHQEALRSSYTRDFNMQTISHPKEDP